MLTGAVMGRGPFYYVTMGSVVAVLALSANTSFADFPRLCRVLAEDRFLPDSFAMRGRRLVYSHGIIVLAVLSGILLVAFGGITDRLIPLFAIGALLAFTMSQAGMVAHWRRVGGAAARHSLPINAAGAVATGVTRDRRRRLEVRRGRVAHGARRPARSCWLFVRINAHYRTWRAQIATTEPLSADTAHCAHRRRGRAVVEQADAPRDSIRDASLAGGLRRPGELARPRR